MNLRETVKLFVPPIALHAVRAVRSRKNRNMKSHDFSHLDEPFRTIKSKVPNQEFNVIFDVGANVGQSTFAYARVLPRAKIFAFEPFPDTFDILKEAIGQRNRIFAYNLALSSSCGTQTMSALGDSSMYRICDGDTKGGVQIESTTVEKFCAQHEIDHVDFMKIDTEGHDLAVLRGCGAYIKNVDFIMCEASANRYNRFHNSFLEIFDYMSDHGFYLFDIQGVAHEWTGGGYPVMRRFDPIFINDRIVGEMTGVINF